MTDDTDIGGRGEEFPPTQLSAILAAAGRDGRARARGYERIVAAYWKPAYKYVRVKWQRSNEDAKDLTQAFFAKVMEKDFLKTYDPLRSRFRTFFRVCLDRFVANEEKAAHRIKRGGDRKILSLDFVQAEAEMLQEGASSAFTQEGYFEAEWVRAVFTIALARLKDHFTSAGKGRYFQIFERYHLSEGSALSPTYESLAEQFNLPVTTITNHLAAARREFRKIVLQELRNLTATEEEFRQEARDLLGFEPS
jgi:RNA polymerase sigma factor (sigma-70 family)